MVSGGRRRIACAIAAALAASAMASCHKGSDHAAGTTITTPTTTTPATPTSTVINGLHGFAPESVTFVSLQAGWVLGTGDCATGRCTQLVRTDNGGLSWLAVPTPDVGGPTPVSGVRFADGRNGWVYHGGLWSTHDGGASWNAVQLPGAADGIFALEAANGFVHAAVLHNDDAAGFTVHIATSPVDRDDWTDSSTTVSAGAGPVTSTQIVVHGAAGWLVQVNRAVVGGARLSGGRWVPWDPPCHDTGGPGLLAASTATDLIAVCDEGLYGTVPRAERAYVSRDGGTTFQPTPVAVPLGCCITALAASGPGTAVVAGATDAKPATAALLRTADGGATWTAVGYTQNAVQSWLEMGFTSSAQGVAIIATGPLQATQLVMTFDGCQSWGPVNFAR